MIRSLTSAVAVLSLGLAPAFIVPLAADPVSVAERAALEAARAPALGELRAGAPAGVRGLDGEERVALQRAEANAPHLGELRGGALSDRELLIILVVVAAVILLVVLL